MYRSKISSRRALRAAGVFSLFVLVAVGPAMAADDLADMSLEDLMNLTVTSASKREENRVDAAAAITVLTPEDIRRSGATSIPEALRMVPGLNVARIGSSRWAISARGYNGQFSNKLLVLIDGRVVYSPVFGGVYWDVQDVVMGDIERIEVIRGPGGTLWGANAVNGVINVTTKSAKDTQGIHAMGLAGNQEYIGEGRFGGMIGEDTAYRVWGRGFKRDDFVLPPGSPNPAHDEWWQWRVGGRFDSQITDGDLVTIQGEFYDGTEQDVDNEGVPTPDSSVRGGDALVRWNHEFSETQSTEVQVYYDHLQRMGDLDETRNTVDVLFQHDFMLGEEDEWLFNWGMEYYWTRDDLITAAGPISFDPTRQDFNRFSGFLQVQWHLFEDRLQLTAGTKLEYNNYTNFEYQPTFRGLWQFVEGNAFWAAISRAVREPTRLDRDIDFTDGSLTVQGDKGVASENLLAYEVGYRNYMLENLSFDLSVFFNDYKDGTIIENVSPILPPDLRMTNGLKSRAWGGEAELAWQAMKDLRFVTSYAYLQIQDEFTTAPTTIQPFGSNDGTSPRHTWMLRGLWNVPVVPVEVDGTVWYVSKLPGLTQPGQAPGGSTVGAYWRLDLRAGWQVTDWLGVDFVAQNVTNDAHAEWGTVAALPLFPGTLVPRSYYGRVTLTFE